MERSSTDLVDVLAFVRVVETGSFARAAERMGLSKPVLSRRVARLEEQLGARLLTRTARGAQPTDIGQAYYARAANILDRARGRAGGGRRGGDPDRRADPADRRRSPSASSISRRRWPSSRASIPGSSSTSSSTTGPSTSPAAATIWRCGSAGSRIRR